MGNEKELVIPAKWEIPKEKLEEFWADCLERILTERFPSFEERRQFVKQQKELLRQAKTY